MNSPKIKGLVNDVKYSIPSPPAKEFDYDRIESNIRRAGISEKNTLLGRLNEKMNTFKKLINIYSTYKNLYEECDGRDNRDDQKDALNKNIQDTIKEINLNKRKTYYESQESSSQEAILYFITILYWIVFIIFISVVLFKAYKPKMRNTLIISIILLIIFPLFINYLLP